MSKQIQALIEGVPSLGSYEGVLAELTKVLDDPISTLVDIAQVVEKDPDLAARLLKLGNSSFFGFPCRLETVQDALNLIGVQQAQDLVRVTRIVSVFKGLSPAVVTMEAFWRHSLGCGVAARILAMNRRLPKAEKFFEAGLLHDLGRLVLYTRAPDRVMEAYQRSQEKRMLLYEAERQVLGFDHTEVGEALLSAWNFPEGMRETVRRHHQPMGAGIFQLEASLVHLADFLVNAMALGSSGESRIPPLDAKSWIRLNFSADILDSVVNAIDTQIEAVEACFLT